MAPELLLLVVIYTVTVIDRRGLTKSDLEGMAPDCTKYA